MKPVTTDVDQMEVPAYPEQPTPVPKARILINVAYDYKTIRTAADDVQKQPHWVDNETVKKLEFSDKWVHSFLMRALLRRRKITRDDKVIPELAKLYVLWLKAKSNIFDYITLPRLPGIWTKLLIHGLLDLHICFVQQVSN